MVILFRMSRQNHWVEVPIFHGWLEHFRFRPSYCQHCGNCYGGHDGRFPRFANFTTSSSRLSNRQNFEADQSCQRHPKITVRPHRFLARLVQHWRIIGPNYLHLRHHRHDTLRPRQTSWGTQWPSQFRDFWALNAIVVPFDDICRLEWRFGATFSDPTLLRSALPGLAQW